MRIEASRIIVRSPNWVGDVVMATPVIRALRQEYADAHIAIVLKPYVRQILQCNPHIDEFIDYDATGMHKGAGGLLGLCRRIRKAQFDLAVILPNSFSSAWMMWLARVPRRMGYRRQWRSWLLTDRLPPPRENGRIVPRNMVDYYLEIPKALGYTDLSRREELFYDDETAGRANALLRRWNVGPDDMLVGLNPGASYGASKLWSTEGFARVGDELAKQLGCRIIIFSAPAEKPLAQDIASRMQADAINPTAEELNLATLKPLVKRCSLLITTDTGPRHYAVAFDVPQVVIMGPTSQRYTDVNLEKQIVLQEQVDCGPCQLKACPTDHRCMKLITSEAVLEASHRALALA